MLAKIKTAWILPLAIGIGITINLNHQALAKEGEQAVSTTDVTEGYKKAPRTDEKQPSEHILSGKWKGYPTAHAEGAIAATMSDKIGYEKQVFIPPHQE